MSDKINYYLLIQIQIKKTHGGGMLAFAWYIWERGFEGKPTIDWI